MITQDQILEVLSKEIKLRVAWLRAKDRVTSRERTDIERCEEVVDGLFNNYVDELGRSRFPDPY